MIMRRCNKAFDERRWRVLLCLLLLLLLFVLGAILDGKLFNTASRRQSPTSSISLRAHAPLWTASEGEAIYQEMQSLQNDEISRLGTEAYRDRIALLTRDGFVSKFIWDYFPAGNACPMKQKLGSELGTGDHGKWVCGVRALLQRPSCIVYSVGSGGFTAFEHDVVRKTQCKVHIFDPTLSLGKQQEIGRVKEFSFHDVGLTSEGSKGNAFTVESSRGTPVMSPKLDLQPLSALMAANGHDWIDVLKVDVEGLEWQIMESWLFAWDVLPFTQLQVELHCQLCYRGQPPDGSTKQPGPRRMLRILQELQRRGLRVFHSEPNVWWGNERAEYMEFAFVQVDQAGDIVTNKTAAEEKSKHSQAASRTEHHVLAVH